MDGAGSDPFLPRRLRMVDAVFRLGLRDDRVRAAMADVPRHLFVPEPLRELAYENRALAIGSGQTISQPYVVARMSEALSLSGTEKVLEVGTGSGYQAAILGRLAREVHTIEQSPALYEEARARLERLGARNVYCYLGDGSSGLPDQAPFDAICVTAASPGVPRPLAGQLAEGGRLVVPIGSRREQRLYRFEKRDGRLTFVHLDPVVFVPLLGEHGWSDSAAGPPEDSAPPEVGR